MSNRYAGTVLAPNRGMDIDRTGSYSAHNSAYQSVGGAGSFARSPGYPSVQERQVRYGGLADESSGTYRQSSITGKAAASGYTSSLLSGRSSSTPRGYAGGGAPPAASSYTSSAYQLSSLSSVQNVSSTSQKTSYGLSQRAAASPSGPLGHNSSILDYYDSPSGTARINSGGRTASPALSSGRQAAAADLLSASRTSGGSRLVSGSYHQQITACRDGSGRNRGSVDLTQASMSSSYSYQPQPSYSARPPGLLDNTSLQSSSLAMSAAPAPGMPYGPPVVHSISTPRTTAAAAATGGTGLSITRIPSFTGSRISRQTVVPAAAAAASSAAQDGIMAVAPVRTHTAGFQAASQATTSSPMSSTSHLYLQPASYPHPEQQSTSFSYSINNSAAQQSLSSHNYYPATSASITASAVQQVPVMQSPQQLAVQNEHLRQNSTTGALPVQRHITQHRSTSNSSVPAMGEQQQQQLVAMNSDSDIGSSYSQGNSGSALQAASSKSQVTAYGWQQVEIQQQADSRSGSSSRDSCIRDVHNNNSSSSSSSSRGSSVVPEWPTLSQALGSRPGNGQGCVGLQNLGNTCYMNSILQSLNTVVELVSWLLMPKDSRSSSGHSTSSSSAASSSAPWGPKAIAAPAYSELVNNMWSAQGSKAVVSPNRFMQRISKVDSRWGDGSQQDSQEFLHSLLEALQKETNRITTKPVYKELDGRGSVEEQAAEAWRYAKTWNDSVIDDIFGGLMQSTIQCQVCKKESHCFEPFLDLAIPIPSSASKNQAVSVQDCLQAFTMTEKLEGGDSYKCEGCKKCQPHTKRLQVYRYPRVLVITLKRFASKQASSSFLSRLTRSSSTKNTSPVSVEVDNLDLGPYCNIMGLRALQRDIAISPNYHLIAISHHSGTLEGGHYTASGRSAADGAWYNFNDSSVRPEGRPSGASSTAYVLFYRLSGTTASL
ncbi:hypothetical protein CEUSTIGMA_g1923.t1 [Chlamydomonas eustigma]|uniref:Ubiquitin carboxyl-terminal hydrolase n=1 Tax=Chlamydomonas eustigma TaxID=1157962 RepID=A0A250WUF9_9CHLO|nr:hypothetical protein CEUSTIGMA_g1923.t1 [Chlamydomonas eustigma]|eukprot:GAX74474.1 hypothetical protein CEUSTIGMA_g1923.t1 [Chlamydomonas eustigma]